MTEDLQDRLWAARNPGLQKKKPPERITVIGPIEDGSPPMALEFVPDEVSAAGGLEQAWCAELPWQPGFVHYRVYLNPANNTFAYQGGADAFGTAEDLSAAMNACAADVVKLGRRHRWEEHMLTHEPPGD